jgi:ADP-dependent NAD(P)H-hydrate dehydratase / NAD(P)H-hydrate epimerase
MGKLHISRLTFTGMKSIESHLSGFKSSYTVFDKAAALSHYKSRDPFANKGTFGHALLLAGSYGKMGAALLAAKSCLCSGAGLLTTHLPYCGYPIMQTALPEAMVNIDENEFHLSNYPAKPDTFSSAGIGPGIGTGEDTANMLRHFLKAFHKPLVIDADALNIIGKFPELLSSLNSDTILTPHPKEFDRMFGETEDELSRFEKAKKMSQKYKTIIVLKGHYTGVFNPDGNISFNHSGNAGMAKGGSGDALTGIITGLLAQSYAPPIAAMLGVYIHGYAGDLAAKIFSEEAMLPSDLIHSLGKVFLELKSAKDQ